MKYHFILIISLYFSSCFHAQINSYILNQSIKLSNDSLSKKEIIKLNLFSYDAYFLGENHASKYVHEKELSFIKILKPEVKDVFLESPVSYYYKFQELFSLISIDTISEEFYYAVGSDRDEYFLRYFYRENCQLNRANKYKITPIDYVPCKAIFVEMFLVKFIKRIKPKQIKTGYRYLTTIKNDTIKYANEDSTLAKYLAFRNNFYVNLPAYKKYLKYNFEEVKKYIDGIYVYSLVKKVDTIIQARSNAREEFMLKNIMAEMKKDSIKKFISINGSYHIPLIQDESWDFMKGWEPLATKFKNNNPTLKVCSTYFMDGKEDDFGTDYFPNEKKLIYDNIKEGETYLIRLDGENTPFKELSKKFQYIVVW